MSNLFETIRQLQPAIPGWCCPEKAEALAAIVLAIRAKVTVEVGIYGGSSFFPLAMAHREMGSGICYGIDPWSTAASVAGEIKENVEFWTRVDHEDIYMGFVALLALHGLTNCTRIIRQRSDEVEPPKEIDVLHLDGNHTEQALRDTERFAPNVVLGGFCIMDDEFWSQGNVTKACALLLKMGFRRLYSIGTGAVFQRL